MSAEFSSLDILATDVRWAVDASMSSYNADGVATIAAMYE
jgi:hypothetical protein